MTFVLNERRWIERIATALGIRVEVEPQTMLNNGGKVQPWARVLDFGAPNGMLIFDKWADYSDCFDGLLEMGYGVSSFSEPLRSVDDDIESMKDALCDWTWTGPTYLKPEWLQQ